MHIAWYWSWVGMTLLFLQCNLTNVCIHFLFSVTHAYLLTIIVDAWNSYISFSVTRSLSLAHCTLRDSQTGCLSELQVTVLKLVLNATTCLFCCWWHSWHGNNAHIACVSVEEYVCKFCMQVFKPVGGGTYSMVHPPTRLTHLKETLYHVFTLIQTNFL